MPRGIIEFLIAGTRAVGAAAGRERVGAAIAPDGAEPDGTATLFAAPIPAFDAPELAVGEVEGEFEALELVVAVVGAELVEPEPELIEFEAELSGAAETCA